MIVWLLVINTSPHLTIGNALNQLGRPFIYCEGADWTFPVTVLLFPGHLTRLRPLNAPAASFPADSVPYQQSLPRASASGSRRTLLQSPLLGTTEQTWPRLQLVSFAPITFLFRENDVAALRRVKDSGDTHGTKTRWWQDRERPNSSPSLSNDILIASLLASPA